LNGCDVGITDGRDFYKSAVEMGSGGMVYLPSFMKIRAGVQVIQRFFLDNLKGCNVGITDGRDL
jgi:hypothetical protein